jgi:hypothetical protein
VSEMVKGLTDVRNEYTTALKNLVEEGYIIKAVTFTDENYMDSYVLLQHPETQVLIKVMVPEDLLELFIKERLINLLQPPEVEVKDTSDYYQLKLNLGDD